MILAAAAMVFYVGSGLVVARAIAGHAAWKFWEDDSYRRGDAPKSGQWVGAWCIASMGAVIWPIIVVLCIIGRREVLVVGAEARAKAVAREKEKLWHEQEALQRRSTDARVIEMHKDY